MHKDTPNLLAMGAKLDIDALPDSAFLTRKQVAFMSGFAVQTFKKWAKIGRGPAITHVEGRPRYRAADVRAWVAGSGTGAQ